MSHNFAPDSDSEDELPPGWEERVTTDGTVYYVNGTTKSTQWTHPRTGIKKVVSGELPKGWEKIYDNGKIIFVDHINKMTTFTDPRLAFATEEKEEGGSIRQKFDSSSTGLQVLVGLDLSGKIAIVTGSNVGIGYETARSLALHGCTVILACRSLSSAQEAIKKILHEKPEANVEAMLLVLDKLSSVRDFASNFCNKYSKLDILILNAAVFGIPYSETEDGFETVFQVNYLSQVYLTLLMEDLLTRASPSRVVLVSSESHRFSIMDSANDLKEMASNPDPRNYSLFAAYNHSKLLQVVFGAKLSEKWASKGIAVFSVHPGNLVSSSISRYSFWSRVLFFLGRPFTKSLQQAASTSLYCATSPDLKGITGCYFNNNCRCEASKVARDPRLAEKAWNFTREALLQSGLKIEM